MEKEKLEKELEEIREKQAKLKKMKCEYIEATVDWFDYITKELNESLNLVHNVRLNCDLETAVAQTMLKLQTFRMYDIIPDKDAYHKYVTVNLSVISSCKEALKQSQVEAQKIIDELMKLDEVTT